VSVLAALPKARQFVIYKLVPLPSGKTDKIPVDIAGRNSNAQNPATWMLPSEALHHAERLGAGYGVGIVLHPASQLFCFDIDGGIDSEIARKLVTDFAGCYVEYSQSGNGLHIFGSYVGNAPPHSCKNIALHIELYTTERFIALTGRTFQNGSPLYDATEQLWVAASAYFAPKATQSDAAWTTEYAPACTITGTDQERIDWLLTHKSMAAKLSDAKVTFKDLWHADADKLRAAWPADANAKSGLPYDGSSADQAFFNHLAFGFGNNCEEIKRVALEHPDCLLRREKWNRADYLEGTILNAVAIPKRWRITRTAVPRFVPGTVPSPPSIPAGGPPPPPSSGAPPPPSYVTPVALPPAVPEALFSCTDQANAQRLEQKYSGMLIAVAGDFYTWDGRRWKLDSGDSQRFACDLSKIVSAERNDISAQFKRLTDSGAEGVGEELMRAEEEIKMLTAWAAKCENVATQNNALALLRSLLNVDVELMDANPWLLNCANGTVNLKTGVLSPHNPTDRITKLTPVAYDPAATCPAFLKFLTEIMLGDVTLVAFLQRWYGYSATGDTREQKILIKHGPGGNGKGTLDGAINLALGEYKTAATMGLLTGRDNAGSTAQLAEIANLRGKRLVTASESEDGARLKEAQLKQLTGEDRLTAKRLYGQLFSFDPTHKLELLTNHRPIIKGSDFSIWRRIMLLNFPIKYGSPDEVAAGEAMVVKDTTLKERLPAEAPGILAWIVQGTAQWLTQGLSPPAAVLNASAEYRQSQDHVAEFVAECCTLERTAKQPLPLLYGAYTAWCKNAGRDHPITRQRFVDELERRVPGFVRPHMSRRTAQGTYVMGLTLSAK
jgi:P4 family phage/plasmid primase-like protien